MIPAPGTKIYFCGLNNKTAGFEVKVGAKKTKVEKLLFVTFQCLFVSVKKLCIVKNK